MALIGTEDELKLVSLDGLPALPRMGDSIRQLFCCAMPERLRTSDGQSFWAPSSYQFAPALRTPRGWPALGFIGGISDDGSDVIYLVCRDNLWPAAVLHSVNVGPDEDDLAAAPSNAVQYHAFVGEHLYMLMTIESTVYVAETQLPPPEMVPPLQLDDPTAELPEIEVTTYVKKLLEIPGQRASLQTEFDAISGRIAALAQRTVHVDDEGRVDLARSYDVVIVDYI